MNSDDSGTTGEAAQGRPGAEGPAPVPGYFPRLLSAAAHVTYVAFDSALEHLGLNQSSFALLDLLAAAPAGEARLAEATGTSPSAVQRDLLGLRSAGYAVPDGAGTWSITDAGVKVIECAQLARAEATLDAEDSQELRQALRALIHSLGLEQPGGEAPPQS